MALADPQRRGPEAGGGCAELCRCQDAAEIPSGQDGVRLDVEDVRSPRDGVRPAHLTGGKPRPSHPLVTPGATRRVTWQGCVAGKASASRVTASDTHSILGILVHTRHTTTEMERKHDDHGRT